MKFNRFIIILACVCLAVAGLLVGKTLRKRPAAPIVEVTGFEYVILEIMGMRGSTCYEILPKGSEAEISFYEIRYREGKDVKELVKRTSCPEETFVSLLNQCTATGWNGFFGAHPKNVSDGEMFEFRAVVNDGLEIRAEGSANFPAHFSEVRGTLNRMLNE